MASQPFGIMPSNNDYGYMDEGNSNTDWPTIDQQLNQKLGLRYGRRSPLNQRGHRRPRHIQNYFGVPQGGV